MTISVSGNAGWMPAWSEQVDIVDGISVVKTVYSKEPVEGLPAPKEGTIYLVSTFVTQACPERYDLLIPANLSGLAFCNDRRHDTAVFGIQVVRI